MNVGAVDLPGAPMAPRYDLVESIGTASRAASLAIEPATGRPGLVYIDTSGLDDEEAGSAPLIHRWHDGWSWRSETLGTLSMRGADSEYAPVNFAADLHGNRHVFAVEPNGDGADDDVLVYFRRGIGGDVRETLAGGFVGHPAFALSPDGQPYAAWLRDATFDGGTLVVRRREANGSWSDVPIAAAAGAAMRPVLAAAPSTLAGFGVHLIWAQTGQSEVHVLHARLGASAPSYLPVLDIAGPRFFDQYLSVAGDGRSEVAVVRSTTPNQYQVERRTLAAGATTWTCPGGECSVTLPGEVPLASAGRAFALSADGRRAQTYLDDTLRPQLFLADPTVAAGWQPTPLARDTTVLDLLFDGAGTLHALLVDDSEHRDLLLVRMAAPWARTRVPAAASVALASVPGTLSIAYDGDGAAHVYARRNAQDGSGAVWSLQGADFVADALPAGYLVDASDLAVAGDGSVHLAFRDTLTQHVFHARRDAVAGSGWTVTRVSRGDGVPASDPQLVFAPGDAPRVIYRQANVLAVAGQRSNGAWLTREITTAGAASRPRASGTTEAHLFYVSWYDSAAQQLRVSSVYGDVADPAQDLGLMHHVVPYPPGWVLGQGAHDLVIGGDGGIAVAYSQSAAGAHGLGYAVFTRENWQSAGSEPLAFGAEPVTRVALDTQLAAAGAPQLAWVQGSTTATQSLHFARKRVGELEWNHESLGSYAQPLPELALSGANGIRIAHAENGALYVAQRREALSDDVAPSLLPLLPASTHLASYCACLYLAPYRQPSQPCEFPERDSGRGAVAVDNRSAVLAHARTRFGTTPAGRYYLTLFAEHSEEIVRLTLGDPLRLEQRARTLGDLMPGLRAFADGDGSGFRLKPATIANARGIWQQWAAAGSPALRNAVNRELTRTGNLETFSGLTFEQWFAALSVGTASDRILVDGFE
jgi:hypothetical protein